MKPRTPAVVNMAVLAVCASVYIVQAQPVRDETVQDWYRDLHSWRYAYLYCGESLAQQGKYKAAIEVLDEGLQKVEGDAVYAIEALRGKADYLTFLGRYDDAIECLKTRRRLYDIEQNVRQLPTPSFGLPVALSADAQTSLQIADILAAAKRWTPAIDELEKAAAELRKFADAPSAGEQALVVKAWLLLKVETTLANYYEEAAKSIYAQAWNFVLDESNFTFGRSGAERERASKWREDLLELLRARVSQQGEDKGEPAN